MSESKIKMEGQLRQIELFQKIIQEAADFLQKFEVNNELLQSLNRLNESCFWFNAYMLHKGREKDQKEYRELSRAENATVN